MTVIEMIGLPGAGKTTLVGKLIDLDEKNNYKFSLLRKKANFKEKIMFLFFLCKFYFFSSKVLSPEIYKRIKYIYILRSCLLNEKHQMLILDQGLVQAVWSLVMRLPKEPKDLTELIRVCCGDLLPNKVIWVKVTPNLAVSRLKKRINEGGNRTGFDQLANEQLVVSFEKGEVLFKKIFMCLNKLGVELVDINDDFNDFPSILSFKG